MNKKKEMGIPEAYDQKFKTLKTNPQLQAVTPLIYQFTARLCGE